MPAAKQSALSIQPKIGAYHIGGSVSSRGFAPAALSPVLMPLTSPTCLNSLSTKWTLLRSCARVGLCRWLLAHGPHRLGLICCSAASFTPFAFWSSPCAWMLAECLRRLKVERAGGGY